MDYYLVCGAKIKSNDILTKKMDHKECEIMASHSWILRLHHLSWTYLQNCNCLTTMKNKSNQNIYSQMQRFADITKTLIMTGNIQRAKRCLKKAEDIFNTGTSEIKNAVVNVYVFSVSTFMEVHHCNIRNFLPEALQIEYLKQIYSSTC